MECDQFAGPAKGFTDLFQSAHYQRESRISNQTSSEKKIEEDLPFEIGDLVRVKTTALYSQVHEMVKDKDKIS